MHLSAITVMSGSWDLLGGKGMRRRLDKSTLILREQLIQRRRFLSARRVPVFVMYSVRAELSLLPAMLWILEAKNIE